MTRLRHGMAKTRIYGVWTSMKARCLNPNTDAYPNYGGRGITVCDRWLVFDNFLADMGVPDIGMTLERLDNNRGYGPDNCVWATRTDQARNHRRNRTITVGDRSHSMTEWAEITGIKAATIWQRLKKGWPEQDAVGVPIVRTRKGVPRGARIYSYGAEHGVQWSE